MSLILARSISLDSTFKSVQRQQKSLIFYIYSFLIVNHSQQSRSRIHERTISLRFLGIILKVLRIEVSVSNMYITNKLQTTFAQGGGVKIRW